MTEFTFEEVKIDSVYEFTKLIRHACDYIDEVFKRAEKDGEFNEKTFVWTKGMENWEEAGNVIEIRNKIFKSSDSTPPPPPQ